MSKITQEIAQQIIDKFCQGSSSYELANKYGLWQTSICNLISGRTWKQCKRPSNIKKLINDRHKKGHFKKGQFTYTNLPLLNKNQNEVILGSLLGDGSLKKPSKLSPNSFLIKGQCLKFHEYLQWHDTIFGSYSGSLRPIKCKESLSVNESGEIERTEVEEHINGYRFQTVSHPTFTEMRSKWYPNYKKIIPKDIQLTPLSIAIWFCDDGSNSYSHREAIFCTQSFTPEECEFLCKKLEDFDIKSRVRFSKYPSGKKPIIKINSTSYDNLIHLIKPYITWNCMKHKIKWRRAKKQWEINGKFTEQDILNIYKLSKTHKQYEIAKIYKTHKNTISSILRGESWQHLFHLCSYIPKSVRRKS